MQFIIFIALTASIAGVYLYYDQKLNQVKKQLMITSNQLRKMKTQYRSLNTISNPLNIKFITPASHTGITNIGAHLFSAPFIDSPQLSILTIKMEVRLLDSALVNNSLWFYVRLPIESDINCRGWILKDEFLTLYPNSTDVMA